MKALLVLLLLSLPASAAKTHLSVRATCGDAVGSTFIFHLKDAIAASARYDLSDMLPGVFIQIVCVDQHDPPSAGQATALSIVALHIKLDKMACWDSGIIYHAIKLFPAAEAKNKAVATLADIDQEIERDK